MKRIHVLTPGFATPNGRAFLMPLILHRQALRDAGIQLSFFFERAPGLTDCDVLAVDSKFHRDQWQHGADPIVAEFADLREKAGRLIYFDTTDSTGCLQIELLPVVDVYCKNQVLKDREEYARPHYGQRIFADYYHQADGVEDAAPLYSNPVTDRSLLSKLQVGWNSGLANYSTYGPYLTAAYQRLSFLPLLRFPDILATPDTNRSSALQCRMGLGHTRESVSHQRRRIATMLEGRIPTTKLSRRQFMEELKHSWAVLSPFGFGEITLKDFEVFLTGALLVKPSMQHLETWPDLFVDDETFAPFKWDLTDLLEVLERVEADRDRYLDMAREGQRRYREVTAGSGAAALFLAQVQKAWLEA